ncbi:hypothetical protein E4U30_005995 [Claviceps sp. LM220 group G6]|nr:hypothetical protein E4U30_005995 [Claviceps sp. LM220 group G6]KAG6109298.1 hypothetical protein E4U31_006998 [Claviceps sp. LM219 group G6]
MDHKLWIDTIQRNPTAGYLTSFCKWAEDMGVRQSADLAKPSSTDLRALASVLFIAFQNHPAGGMLRLPDESWAVKAATPPSFVSTLS